MIQSLCRTQSPILLAGILVLGSGCNGGSEPPTVDSKSDMSQVITDRKLPPDLSKDELYHLALRSVAWIHSTKGRGTGWLVDEKRKLLITNDHVVRRDKNTVDLTVQVVFPVYRDENDIQSLIQERRHYEDILDQVLISAELIHTDPKRDLAIVQLSRLPPQVHKLGLASNSCTPGENVHSVGNPGASTAVWVYSGGTVRAVHRKKVRYADAVLDARVVETQAPVNPGDSGGPVLNDAGELTAVVQGGNLDPSARLFSYCIDVAEVKDFLAEADSVLNPRTPQDHLAQAISYRRKGRYDRAIEILESVKQLGPDVVDKPRCWLEQGIAFALRNRPAFAPGTDPEQNPAEHFFGDEIRAKDCLDKALQLNPRLAEAYEWRAGMADWSKVIELDPEHETAYLKRARFLLDQGDVEGARTDLQAAARLPLGDAGPHILSDYFELVGRMFMRTNDFDLAIQQFDLLIKLHPDRAWGYAFRGPAYQKWAQAREQSGDVRRAIELHNRGVDDNLKARQLDKSGMLAFPPEALERR